MPWTSSAIAPLVQWRGAITRADYRRIVASLPPEVQDDPSRIRDLTDPAMLARLPSKMLTDKQIDLVRRSNHTVPLLPGMRVIGAVEDAEGDAVTIETGHRVKTTVNRADVSISTLFTTTTAGRSAPRRTPYHPVKGDVVELMVHSPTSPFKSPWLDMPHRDIRLLYRKVFEELKIAHHLGLQVDGRVLNKVVGGYAVGIAGMVAFLPNSRAAPSTVRRVGALNKFTVYRISGSPWNHDIVVADTAWQGKHVAANL